MAILESVPGISATVRIDGQDVDEYIDDENDERKTTSKYVECVSNKDFSVFLSVCHPYVMDCPSLSINVEIDGTRVRSKSLRKENYRPLRGWSYNVIGCKTNCGNMAEIRSFRFSEIKITLDDNMLATLKEDVDQISKVGEIVVRFYRASFQVRERRNERPQNQPPKTPLGEIEVHEKALKGQAKSHGLSFGEPSPASLHGSYKCNYLDGRDHPLATFKFKYRSKESLKQLLIIERTPEPEDLESSVPNQPAINVDNLTQDQKSQLEEFLQNLTGSNNAADRKIKREIKREHEDGESSEASRKRARAAGVETVDLTGDD